MCYTCTVIRWMIHLIHGTEIGSRSATQFEQLIPPRVNTKSTESAQITTADTHPAVNTIIVGIPVGEKRCLVIPLNSCGLVGRVIGPGASRARVVVHGVRVGASPGSSVEGHLQLVGRQHRLRNKRRADHDQHRPVRTLTAVSAALAHLVEAGAPVDGQPRTRHLYPRLDARKRTTTRVSRATQRSAMQRFLTSMPPMRASLAGMISAIRNCTTALPLRSRIDRTRSNS